MRARGTPRLLAIINPCAPPGPLRSESTLDANPAPQYLLPDTPIRKGHRVLFRTAWSDKGLSFDFNQLLAPATIDPTKLTTALMMPTQPPRRPGGTPTAGPRWKLCDDVQAASTMCRKIFCVWLRDA